MKKILPIVVTSVIAATFAICSKPAAAVENWSLYIGEPNTSETVCTYKKADLSNACIDYLDYDTAQNILTIKKGTGKSFTLTVLNGAKIKFDTDLNPEFFSVDSLDDDTMVSFIAGAGSLTLSGVSGLPNNVIIDGAKIAADTLGSLKSFTMDKGELELHDSLSANKITINDGNIKINGGGIDITDDTNGSFVINSGSLEIMNSSWGISTHNAATATFNGGITKIINAANHAMWNWNAADLDSALVFGDNMGIAEKSSYVFWEDPAIDPKDSAKQIGIVGSTVTIAPGYTVLKHHGWLVNDGEDNNAGEENIINPNTSDKILPYILTFAAVALVGFCGKKIFARH